MNRTIKTVLVTLALLAGASAPMLAQGRLGISFEKRGREREIKFGIDIGHGHQPVLHGRGHVHTDCCRRWVPPHCETITDRVWIQPRCERVWVPPVCDLVSDGRGRTRRVIVREGYWNTVHHPGRWACATRKVHVPGRWELTCGR